MIRRVSVEEILTSYNDRRSLSEASHHSRAMVRVDPRIAELEAFTVFSKTWQVIGRADQVQQPGQFITASSAGEPIVAVRGTDGQLRAFSTFAVTMQRKWLRAMRHRVNSPLPLSRVELRGLDGALKGMPEFDGVKGILTAMITD